MISTFLILSVAAFSSLVAVAEEGGEYSLWPRRPVELEQARGMVREQQLDEAVELLRPFVREKGIAGREARQISGAINVRRYLSRNHPGAQTHKVRRGETLARIAADKGCPTELLMLLNGITEPSDLKVGQLLVYVPMNLRLEVRPLQRELSVWDENTIVASYNILQVKNYKSEANAELTVSAREGYINGVALPSRSVQFLSSERVLVLSDGSALLGGESTRSVFFRLAEKDINELALLLGVGARVSVISDEQAFSSVSHGE